MVVNNHFYIQHIYKVKSNVDLHLDIIKWYIF